MEKIKIYSDFMMVHELKEMIEHELPKSEKDVTLEIQKHKDKRGISTDVLVALIAFAGTSLSILITAILQAYLKRKDGERAEIYIKTKDGQEIRFPVNTSKKDMEKYISIIKALETDSIMIFEDV